MTVTEQGLVEEQTGLDWLPDLPPHWRTEKGKRLFTKMERPPREIDDVVTCFRDGQVTLRKNRRTEGFTESLKEIGYQGVRKGDLVIHAMDAFAGAIGVSDSDGKSTPVYAVCLPQSDANPAFYAHLLREMSRAGFIQALAKGIRERSTDFRYETFANLFLPVPPRAEQDAIVAYLDGKLEAIDRYLRVKEREIALLEERKRALIHRAVTRGLDDNPQLQPSGIPWLPEIPISYERTKMSRVCTSIRDGTHNPPAASEGIHRLLSVRNIQNGKFSARDDDRTMAAADFAILQRSYTVEEGDIVLALVGATTGKSAVVELMENVTVQRSLGILRPDRSKIESSFLDLLIQSDLIQTQIRETMDKYAAQPGIYLNDVAALQLVFPPLKEQSKIVDFVEGETSPITYTIARARRQIERMQEYRTALIAEAVTGRLNLASLTDP